MKSKKVHVMNVIHSWRSLRLEKTYSRWPLHDFLWRANKFMCWMLFTVEDHYNLRKHIHIDHNMIFYEERKTSSDECHSELKTSTTWENTCTLTITWFFMNSEKIHVILVTITWSFMNSEKLHVMNVIQSWRPQRLEKTHARWP